MPFDPATPLIAVDIGNTRLKLGLFNQPAAPGALPAASRVLELPAREWQWERIAAWLPHQTWSDWRIASVNRPATAQLMEAIQRHEKTPAGTPVAVRLLMAADFPLEVELEHPDRVGADRLASAAAANRLRAAERGAIVVDFGSAVTVDLVSAAGAFRGGAILPGLEMAARALHEFTDLLPLAPLTDLAEPPPALGISTVTAIRSGLYWSLVGAVRELVARLSVGSAPPPEVFLTGGAAPYFAPALKLDAKFEPHLVLSGIALAD